MRTDNYNAIEKRMALREARTLYKKVIAREKGRKSKHIAITQALADAVIMDKSRLDNLVRQYHFTREELS